MDELNINILWRSVPIDGVIFNELQTGNRLLLQSLKVEYNSSNDLTFKVIRVNKNDGVPDEKSYTMSKDKTVFQKKLPIGFVGYKVQFEISGVIDGYLTINNIEIKAGFIPTGNRV